LASIEGPTHAGLPAEAALLLATAGGPAMDDAIRSLAASVVDWTRFLQIAAQERSEAIVAQRFKALDVMLPAAVDKELKVTALRADLRMARLTQRLEETLKAFKAAGIPLLLLKGAGLGKTVYGFVPRRPMLDLDLLIPPDRRQEAVAVALNTGWATTQLSQYQDFYSEHHHLPPLVDKRSGQFNLELHTGLMPAGHPFNWQIEQLWDRATLLPGGLARVPAVNDLLLHNALHFSWSHVARFGPWRSFRDIETLHGSVNWSDFVAECRTRRASSAAYWALYLARLHAGVAIPAQVERDLQPPLPLGIRGPLARHFAQLWFPTDLACPSRRLELTLWHLAMRPGHSGHGKGRPWSRDELIIDRLHEPPESLSRKVIRHLATGGRYTRYLSRIALGRS
jgi:hypothetical protein